MEREALKLATEGLERILGSFEKDGKVVMKSMIRNELFAEMHLLLKKVKKALANPAQPPREWVGLTVQERNDCLVQADPCECLADTEAHQLMVEVEVKLRERNL